MSIARGSSSGALFQIDGTIPNNATWSEDIYFSEAGVATDLTDLSFRLTLRRCSDAQTADLTLSTDDGTLSIAQDDNDVDVLRINVAAGVMANYSGHYTADLASRDTSGKVTLWGHGIITLTPCPVAWS